MVNFRMLAAGAKRARAMVEQQGGSEAVRDKVDRLRDVAMSEGTVSERAKAAAEIAREKPKAERPASAPSSAAGAKADPPGPTEQSSADR